MSSLTNYQSIRANLESVLLQETLYEAAHGPKLTYSLDGENYTWTEWKEAVLRQISALRQLENAANPYIVTSRGRLGSRPSP